MSPRLLFLASCLLVSFPLLAEEKKPVPAPAPAPAPTTEVKVVEATDLEALKANVNQKITVRGKVERTKDWDGGSTPDKATNFINFAGGEFTVVVFKSDYGKFPSKPAELYRGKTLEVTGRLDQHKGKWQIKVTAPDQVKVVEAPAEPAPAEAPKKEAP